MNEKLNRIFNRSQRLSIDDNSKIVIMSDCHRGDGNNFDNFLKNQNIFQAALQYYYIKGFIYLELGDGDDMWEVKNYKDIVDVHLDSFKQLKKFNDSNRLIMIYGNHDIVKRTPDILEKNFYKYYDKLTKKDEDLLVGLKVYESLVLNYKNHDIFVIHGHQVDFLNSTFWRFSRFLVRNIWKNLEHSGVSDPTGAAKNYGVTKNTEKKLEGWSIKNNKILIAGHTHRAIFPKKGQSLYFNDGSCIHPNGITCLEIENGNITLVRWQFELKNNEVLSAGRKILEGAESISSFFNNISYDHDIILIE